LISHGRNTRDHSSFTGHSRQRRQAAPAAEAASAG
jgi:hypothetical protein